MKRKKTFRTKSYGHKTTKESLHFSHITTTNTLHSKDLLPLLKIAKKPKTRKNSMNRLRSNLRFQTLPNTKPNLKFLKSIFHHNSKNVIQKLSKNLRIRTVTRSNQMLKNSNLFHKALDKHAEHFLFIRYGKLVHDTPEFYSFLRVFFQSSLKILKLLKYFIEKIKGLLPNKKH